MTAADTVWKSSDGTIMVARVGSIEIRSGIRSGRTSIRWADGYAVIRDGLVQYPWTQKREAVRQAKALAVRLGQGSR